MTLSAVCWACAGKLQVPELGVTKLDQVFRCEACGIDFQVNENGTAIDYEVVTPEQLAEIRAKE